MRYNHQGAAPVFESWGLHENTEQDPKTETDITTLPARDNLHRLGTLLARGTSLNVPLNSPEP